MRYITKIVGLIVLLAFFNLEAQTPEQSFEAGNTQYAEGRFQEAIDAYKKVLDSGQESAALYFNLANANYKLNNIAPSVYYYEKALRLDPTDTDVKNNIQFAEKMKIDAITPLPENTVKKWFNSVLNLLTVDGWAYATILFVFLFVILFVAYYFTFGSGKKRALFTTSFLSLMFAILSLVFAYNAFAKAEKDKPAIVFSKEVDVKAEPNLSSPKSFTLHEGTKVMILDTENNWKRVQLADGKSGWIPISDIKEL